MPFAALEEGFRQHKAHAVPLAVVGVLATDDPSNSKANGLPYVPTPKKPQRS
jgi:hypothetical protein